MSEATFGLFDWVDAGDRPLHQLYDDRLAMIGRAEELGFVSYQMAEHHCTPLGMSPSPGPFLAAVARETTTMRFGPLVYLLPLYEPLRLVEEIAQLDQLSKGRFDLGVGRGVSPWELRHFGVDPEHNREIFNDVLGQILAGLRGDGSSFGSLGGAPLEIEPYQKPHPPVWYASNLVDSMRWAGEQGLNLATNGPAEPLADNVAVYRSAWRDHAGDKTRIGAHVEAPTVALIRQVVVADTDAEALELVRETAHPRWAHNFMKLWYAHDDPAYASRVGLAPALAGGSIVAGSPETVRRSIADALAVSGVDRINCCLAWGALDADQVERSMDLFAAEVMDVATGR